MITAALLYTALGALLAVSIKSIPSIASIKSIASIRKPRRRPARISVWAHEPMTDDELRSALGALTLEDRTLRAILQVLQENLDLAISEVGAVSIADRPGALAHTAGGIEWLQFLQSDLANLMTGETRKRFHPLPSATAKGRGRRVA